MVLWFVGLTNRSARDFIVQTETLWPRVRLKSYHEWITMDHYRLLIFPLFSHNAIDMSSTWQCTTFSTR